MTSPDYGTGDGAGGPLKRVRVPVAVHRVGFSQSHYGGRRWQGRKVSCLGRHRLSSPHWPRGGGCGGASPGLQASPSRSGPASLPHAPPPSGSCRAPTCDPRGDGPERRRPERCAGGAPSSAGPTSRRPGAPASGLSACPPGPAEPGPRPGRGDSRPVPGLAARPEASEDLPDCTEPALFMLQCRTVSATEGEKRPGSQTKPENWCVTHLLGYLPSPDCLPGVFLAEAAQWLSLFFLGKID
ncbi:translation initiation factor IF-2-like [Psammomys obesus]|uniref:translation initiation factor IF-2-like n=1 Tax=Psammomys obesus TaxID=48139 RepID=UPI002452F8FF|nr:translation initiation factor IF-2-like [Psammomys obesus]